MKPYVKTAMLARKPAIGPATPISNIAFLDGTTLVVRMTAPNVPKFRNNALNGGIVGKGMKYGNVVSTPCARAAK